MLTKKHYEKQWNPEGGYHVFKKVLGERTKNHQRDGETLENSGLIPFCDNEQGYNPGKLISLYMKYLHPDNPFLFQRPRRPAKDFSVDTAPCLFEDDKQGKNKTAICLATICETLAIPRFTNHSVRSTAIHVLKQYGYQDREIQRLSGHRSIESLNNYDPSNSVEQKAGMAFALMNKKKAEPAPDEAPAPKKMRTAASTVTSGSYSDVTNSDDSVLSLPEELPAQSQGSLVEFTGFSTQQVPQYKPSSVLATSVSSNGVLAGSSAQNLQAVAVNSAKSMETTQLVAGLIETLQRDQAIRMKDQELRSKEQEERKSTNEHVQNMSVHLLELLQKTINKN